MVSLNLGHTVALQCLGTIEGPQFLDGRTADGSVGLAPSTAAPFTGTRWLVAAGPDAGQVVLKCLGTIEGPQFLDGRTGDGSVGLAPGTGTPFSGTRWAVNEIDPGSIILQCLGDIEGPRFLNGKTADGSVSLAPATEAPFSGTRWAVVDFGPFPLQPELQFDVNSIVFDTGVPVGGFAHLTLRQDGSFTFSGHFHDSGADEFNVGLVWGVKDVGNRVYTVQHSGHVAGTFEPGSRDDDWNVDGRNDAIARHWTALAAGATARFEASTSADLVNLSNSLLGAAGLVMGVVALV